MKFLFYFKVLFAFVLVFGAAKAFTINCDYSIVTIYVFGFVYTCETTNFPLSSGNRVTAVTGQHWSGRTNDDVEFIWIKGNRTLSFVPQGFSNFFPNIKAIDIWFSSLDILYGDELNEYPQLQRFCIWQSNLTTISSRLFENTPKLIEIYFTFTQLERVGRDLFTPLNVTQLQWVDSTGNHCIDQLATTQTEIIQLISDIRVLCPFDDEENVITTTTQGLTCSERQIEDLVCDLKDEMKEVQESLAAINERIDRIESNLPTVKEETKNEIENLQIELNHSRNELKSVKNKINELENEQNKANEKIKKLESDLTVARDEQAQMRTEFESRILWLEEGNHEMSANPCAYN